MAKKGRSPKTNSLKKYKRYDIQRSKIQRKNVLERKKKRLYKTVNIFDQDYVNIEPVDIYKNNYSQKNLLKKWDNIINVSRETQTPRPRKQVFNTLQITNNMPNIKDEVCARRREKRRALFRSGKAGKGVAGPIEKLKNITSDVRC